MATELDPGRFLWVDRQPEKDRPTLLRNLRQGRVLVEPLQTRENGNLIPVPDGLIHHWIATIFVPGVTLQQTLALVQDYDHHQDVYKPDIQRSKILSTDGRNFRVYLRLYRKTIVTVTYNTEVNVRYFPVDAARLYSRSYSTRIAEVDDAGKASEHEKPVGNDHGYLWRLYIYSRYQERDGGVYIQIEFIALSRTVPSFLAWLVNPYIKSIPRDYLVRFLEGTRAALWKRKEAASRNISLESWHGALKMSGRSLAFC